MKLTTYIIILAVMAGAACGAIEYNESYDNFTLTFSNDATFLFNFSGIRNLTFDLTGNNITIYNTTGGGGVLFNLSINESWELRQVYDKGCYVPYINYTPTTTAQATLCDGRYYLDDGIIIGANDIELDCNGAELRGSGIGKGIYTVKDRVRISNCSVNNYQFGIFTTGNNLNLSYSTISNTSTYGVYLATGGDWHIIDHNNFLNNSNNVRTDADARHINVSYNAGDGDWFFNTENDYLLFHNNVLSSEGESILDIKSGTDNINIHNNTLRSTIGVENSVIVLNNVSYSTISDNQAEGGKYSIWIKSSSSYNNITQNTVLDSYYSITTTNASHNYIANNIVNNTNRISSYHGILIYLYSINNTVFNNVVDNVQFGILHETNSEDTQSYNNTIINSLISFYELHNTKNNIFKDNLLICSNEENSTGVRFYDGANESTSYSNIINDCDFEIKFDNEGKVLSLVDGLTYNATNNTIQLRALPTHNTICPSNQSTCIKDFNGAQYNETIGAGNRSLIFSRTQDNDPYPVSIATTITDLDWTYTDASSLSISCTGTGNMNITNLADLQNEAGEVSVYHNGAFVEYIYTTTYTTTDCSDWEFTNSGYRDQYVETSCEGTRGAVMTVFSLVGVIVLVIIGGFVLMIWKSNLNFDFEEIHKLIIVLVVLALIGAVAFVILAQTCML